MFSTFGFMGGEFYREQLWNKFFITISHFFTSRELDFFDIDASGNFPKNVKMNQSVT